LVPKKGTTYLRQKERRRRRGSFLKPEKGVAQKQKANCSQPKERGMQIESLGKGGWFKWTPTPGPAEEVGKSKGEIKKNKRGQRYCTWYQKKISHPVF